MPPDPERVRAGFPQLRRRSQALTRRAAGGEVGGDVRGDDPVGVDDLPGAPRGRSRRPMALGGRGDAGALDAGAFAVHGVDALGVEVRAARGTPGDAAILAIRDVRAG